MVKRPPTKFTNNEAIAMTHECRAADLRAIADHFEKWNYPTDEAVAYLRELADMSEAQAIVVKLRDEL